MRNKFKKALAVLASAAMCGSMLLYFPDGTFDIDLTAHAAEGEVAINEENFPDEVFRTYVDKNFDRTNDDTLDAAEIAMVTRIAVYDMGISDLKGVEYFTALAYLSCSNNQLTSLDVSKNTALTDLYCYSNQLTSLDVSKNTALTTLSCESNQLTSLDVTNNTALTKLYCHSNQLTSLDVSKNMALTYLDCHFNQLTSLDVTNNTALTKLYCHSNQLTSLDVSKNMALTYLDCESNQLTSLDVTNNTALTFLLYYYNTYKITLTGNTFDLSTLPEGFDVKKASGWTNATIEGNTLTVTDLTDPTQGVTYAYVLGNGSTATFTLKIASAKLTEDMVPEIKAQTYTGEKITPVTLICGKYTLVEGTDYTIEYADNTNAGTASYTITGAGIFTGELTGKFEIVKAIPKYDIPTNLVASDGVTLADVELPEGFAWADETEVIGKQGTHTFLATFTPKDTVNYKIVENIEITVESGIAINEENFPDPIFRTYVDKNFDTTDDNALDAAEIAMVTRIDVDDMGISDLKGVEYFTALTYLDCKSNQLTSLDVTNNTTLTNLYCNSNQLTSLDVTNNTALEILYCDSNQLTSLDVRKNTALTALSCGFNQLTSLDVSKNMALTYLDCEFNQLTSLDVTNNTALTTLKCYSNHLTSLDVTNNTALTKLYCGSNQLTSLDVTNNTALNYLYCESNTYKINLTGNTFDLSTLPEGFDVTKASKWTNATIEGNTLTVTDPTRGVTYTYDLGNGSTARFTLEIASAKLTKDMVPEIKAQTYTGKAITPVTLICGDYTLVEGTDYTIEYADNTNAGTASYTITGAGIFTGELTGKFEIVKASGIAINETNFPDEVFRTYVDKNFDTTDDDTLDAAEIAMVTRIAVYDMGISDLKGVEYFTALTYLNCFDNQLTSLDVTNNTALTELDCSNNQLTSLDVTNNTALTYLNCGSNQLTSLDVTNNTALTDLSCHYNQLTSLDVTNNTALNVLYCGSNQLTSLDVSKNMALTDLGCGSNQLTSLDVSKNTALTYLDCESNQLTSLDVTNNTALKILDCHYNQLTSLDVTNNTALTYLNCESNQLTSLDVSKNTALTKLYCESNQLTSLDVSKNMALTNLNCGFNQLTSLDVTNNTALTDLSCHYNQLTSLDVTNNTALTYLDCGFNQLTSLDVTNNTALTYLHCGHNQLTSLDVTNNTALNYLDCHYNQLTSLDVTNNTALTYLNCESNQLTSLDVRKNTALTKLYCESNQLTSLDVSKNMALTNLNCGSNQLTSLDVTNNTALTHLNCNSNTYEITLTGNTFDLSTLPEGFDVTKASVWTNATIEGNTLTVTKPTKRVTYTYDLGNDSTAIFTLEIASAELTKDMVQKIEAQTYTGKAITPVTLICGDYTLVEGTDYTIEYADNTNAGTASYTITGAGIFTGELTGKFEIVKAIPEYKTPTNLTATYGDILADVELPEGWAWVNNTQPVGTVGTSSFDAVFTPADTANYNTVTELVDITVGKATPKVTPIIPDGEYTEGDALPKISFKSVTDGVIEWITKLVDGLIEGENELEWQFTPDDTDNYKVVTGTAIVEAQATTTTTTTTTAQPTTTSTTTTTTVPTTTSTTTTQPTTTSTTTTTQPTTTRTTTTTQPTTTSTTTTTTTSADTTTSTTKTTTTTTHIASATTTQPTTTSTTTTTTTSTDTTTSTTGTTTTTTHIASATTTQPTTTGTTTTSTDTTTSTTESTTTTTHIASTTTTQPTTTGTTTTSTDTTTSTTESTTTTTHIASATTTQPTTTSTTTTSTDTTTSATESTTTTTHIASDEELCEWAVKDYEGKTGVTPANAEIEYATDDTAVITLTDAEGNVLDVYTIDPTTGTGTDSDGADVNLPQTGYSVVYNYIMLAAAAMVFFGIFAMAKSRKRNEE